MTSIIEFILNGIFSIFKAIALGIAGLLDELVEKKQNADYSASFGEPRQQLERKGDGWRVGYEWCVPFSEAPHMITIGGSGSGKTSCVAHTLLLQSHGSSYVVFDSARTLLKDTGPMLRSRGYKVYVFDYDNYETSIGFNPLDESVSKTDIEIYRIAHVLNQNKLEGNPNDFWSQSGEDKIGFFGCLLRRYAEKEFCNFANLLHMTQTFSFAEERIAKWLVQRADEKDWNKFRALTSAPEKTKSSVTTTALNTLSLFNKSNIAAITSKNTLPFQNFRQERSALFICGSPIMSRYARGITAMYFDSFFAHVLEKLPTSNDLPITFLIDEANSFWLESLPQILELGRRYGISVSTLWQDFSQVENLYKKLSANVLTNSMLAVYMPGPKSPATCRMLEELLGKYTVETEHGTKTRELRTASEVFREENIIVLNGSNAPLLLPPKPFYESRKLRKLTQMPPYELPKTGLTLDVPLLKF